MDTSLIGQEVELNGKTYKVIGTVKKSYLLEKDGKQYKATADKIKKIQNHNTAKAQASTAASSSSAQFPFLENKLRFIRIFDKSAQLPTNEQECMSWFFQLSGELSPENLHCDGEASRSQVQQKLKNIRGAWKELERIAGKKFSEGEIENLSIKNYLNNRKA
jgi:hypothetical protein